VTAIPYDGRWLDVSNLWDLLTVNAALIGNEMGAEPDSPDLGNSVAVADDVAVAGNVRVASNVTIGEYRDREQRDD